jgi:hypothetical protein
VPRRSRAVPKAIYQLKVTLEHVKPLVWRRLLVPSNIPLHKLHAVLQEAMGWTDSHLHAFSFRDRRIGDISIEDGFEEQEVEDERKVRLDELVGPDQVLLYEYDFGDGWLHQVCVEKRLEPDPRLTYPLCVGGARACPPEDCGGPPGYERLLAALKNPSHEEHGQLVTWSGGAFDPEGFDSNRVNAALRALR